jgi:hypothetical protein
MFKPYCCPFIFSLVSFVGWHAVNDSTFAGQLRMFIVPFNCCICMVPQFVPPLLKYHLVLPMIVYICRVFMNIYLLTLSVFYGCRSLSHLRLLFLTNMTPCRLVIGSRRFETTWWPPL